MRASVQHPHGTEAENKETLTHKAEANHKYKTLDTGNIGMAKGKRGHNLRPDAANGKRFGDAGGADPSTATKSGAPKWSIRQSVKYLSGKSIDEINALGRDNEPTVAQLIAAVALKKALKGDMAAVNFAVENVDGKLPQETQLTGKDGDALQAPVIYLPANGRDSN